jgi:hypothetical protein
LHLAAGRSIDTSRRRLVRTGAKPPAVPEVNKFLCLLHKAFIPRHVNVSNVVNCILLGVEHGSQSSVGPSGPKRFVHAEAFEQVLAAATWATNDAPPS